MERKIPSICVFGHIGALYVAKLVSYDMNFHCLALFKIVGSIISEFIKLLYSGIPNPPVSLNQYCGIPTGGAGGSGI